MDIRFLTEQNIFLHEQNEIIWYIFHIKNILDFSLTHLKFYHGNEIFRTFRRNYWKYNCFGQEFCSNFNYYSLPGIKSNGNCLINNNDPSLDAVNLYICYELD